MASRPAVLCARGPSSGGGGVVTLVHASLQNKSQVREHAQELIRNVRIELTRGAVLVAVNLHLRPALPTVRRRAVTADASAFLRTPGASVKIVARDLDNAQGPRGGGWLSKAPSPKGALAGFRAPYQPGDPTNVVWLVGRPSKRDLDWVLVGPETPCVRADKVLVPGRNTQRIVQCDLVIAERVFAAADPSYRRIQWSQLRPQQQAPVAAAG